MDKVSYRLARFLAGAVVVALIAGCGTAGDQSPTPGTAAASQTAASSTATSSDVAASADGLPPLSPPPSEAESGATVPDAGVMGGGPLGGGDPEAVARIDAQLPDLSSTYDQEIASAAFGYIAKLAEEIPSLGSAFNALGTVGRCALDYGIVGARAYIAQDLSAAGAIVVVSHNQLSRAGQIALECLYDRVVSGGGPADGFDPCLYWYSYETVTNGVADRYYVFVAGTNEATCADIYSVHRERFTLLPID